LICDLHKRYEPRVFENFITDVDIDGEHVELALWDTAGQEEYDRLRPLTYSNANVILICFAIDCPDSLENVQEKWISEVMHFCPGLPLILVGCKLDLRGEPKVIGELSKAGQRPITLEEVCVVHYLLWFCSASTLNSRSSHINNR